MSVFVAAASVIIYGSVFVYVRVSCIGTMAGSLFIVYAMRNGWSDADRIVAGRMYAKNLHRIVYIHELRLLLRS